VNLKKYTVMNDEEYLCEFCKKPMEQDEFEFCDICPNCLENGNYFG